MGSSLLCIKRTAETERRRANRLSGSNAKTILKVNQELATFEILKISGK
jgi:hypothetical protein